MDPDELTDITIDVRTTVGGEPDDDAVLDFVGDIRKGEEDVRVGLIRFQIVDLAEPDIILICDDIAADLCSAVEASTTRSSTKSNRTCSNRPSFTSSWY